VLQVTKVVRDGQRTVLDLLDGAKMEPLSPLREDAYCVMKGTIPSGVSVPLHSHGDAESFYVLSGEAQALVETEVGLQWQTLRPGDFIHIPGGTKHAWRNVSGEPMAALITCTAKLGRALREMGQLTSEGGKRIPTPADVQRLIEISERYGYWLGSREENAAVGIELA
jgi:quercetin dioxygenase-like cupin family protein